MAVHLDAAVPFARPKYSSSRDMHYCVSFVYYLFCPQGFSSFGVFQAEGQQATKNLDPQTSSNSWW